MGFAFRRVGHYDRASDFPAPNFCFPFEQPCPPPAISRGYLGSVYMSFDGTAGPNPNYFGVPTGVPALYLDYSGAPFSLQSLFAVTPDPNNPGYGRLRNA